MIGDILLHFGREADHGPRVFADLLALVAEGLCRPGLEDLTAPGFGDRVAIRPLDLAFAVNRLRTLVCGTV